MVEDVPLMETSEQLSAATSPLPWSLVRCIKIVSFNSGITWHLGVVAIGAWCFCEFGATKHPHYAVYSVSFCVMFPINSAATVYAHRSHYIYEAKFPLLHSWCGLCLLVFTSLCNLAVVVWAIGLWSGRMQWLMHGGEWVAFPVIVLPAMVGQCQCLVIGANVCYSMVQRIIDDITVPEKVDWDRLVEEVHNLQQRLAQVWTFSEVAAPIFICVGSGVFTLGITVLFQITGIGSLALQFFLFSAGCVYVAVPLALLASISSMCRDRALNANSIPAAASRCMKKFTKMPEEERVAYNRFLLLMRSEANPLCITFCGVAITLELVVATFIKVAVGFPAAYGVLKQVLHSEGSK